jgi:hypothetical protein
MDIFEVERAVLRLKEMVNVKTDKDIAALLGMDVSAFNKRKKRNSFPEKELLALAADRPELGIDTHYVLTGQRPVAAKPAWLRLKSELEMHEDSAVAEWLGMDMAAVNAFTMRGVFPVQQFLAAYATHHDPIDKDYVLTGVNSAAHSIIDDVRKSRAAGTDPVQERQIIDKYRSDTLFRQAVNALFALSTRA